MYDLVVIGSGPGGSSAAVAAAQKGKRVLIIERGPELQSTPGKRTTGQLLNALKHLDDLAPNVAGGGSAINYGVVATPTVADVERAVGSVATPEVMRRFPAYLRHIGRPQATKPSTSVVH